MPRKIQVNRLEKEELTYELTAIQLKKSGDSLKYPAYTYTFDQDYDDIKKKLDSLTDLVEVFDKAKGVNFNEKLGIYEKRNVHVATPSALSFVEGQVGASTFQQGLAYASRSSSVGDVNSPMPVETSLRFSGDKKPGMSISASLERVEELKVARNVSKDTLYSAGIDLFCNKAYQEEYLSSNYYEEELFEEQQKMTQHSSEIIGVYLAVMVGYFNRLRCTISKEEELKIILKNFHPFYLERLKDPLPMSISDLSICCRSMEARREMINRYVASRRGNSLEKDLAYVDVTKHVTAIESTSHTQLGRSLVKTITCYNCNQPERKAIGCALPRKLICFKCKNEGGRLKYVGSEDSAKNLKSVLDFILDHAQEDESPYLKVSVIGKTLLGLLDSGVSSTTIGSKGWKLVKDLGFVVDATRRLKCKMANGELVESAWECEISFCVRNRVKLIKVLVVPELPHTLILGINFWQYMGIVPDLRQNEWLFSNQPVCLDETDHLRSKSVLTTLQEARLQALLD
ncbi:hypothetical protein NQ314_013216 [Rhamnusium bicolor]|uniref:Uncharacterized protein n=1 Tax=Rhamnusium bicolor TaxID=1586634 RepID=A0AAV8X804_9CUCU|nr:hypothetical protein NQ314_013216 [Rhamnusium bicolor]